MRIQFKMEGGLAYFPGLAKPVTIDSDQLPQEEASELEQRVSAVHFFDLPRTVGAPPRGAADFRQYLITVEDRGRRHSVQLTDPVEDSNLQALLDYLKKKVKTLRAGASDQRSEA